jgi:hypothetical protein
MAMENGTIVISSDITDETSALLTIEVKYQPNSPAGAL